MSEAPSSDFPLFPLGIVALPHESIPLHIFEDRYRRMIERCLAAEQGALEQEFGIVWLSQEELKPIGCACTIEEVLERLEDGRLNILVRGTRPFRLLQRQDELPFPAGVVEFLHDERPEELDREAAGAARELYRELVREATDRELEAPELERLDSYSMAATVEFAVEAKQELLELRSENARLRLLAELLQSALERLDLVERAQARALSNGKVRFG
ncbi:MAG: LON peptidase substrate-binding domain-containing protein [Solirubrobacterales bacterium]|nr:LON peptidase substrate-binding domain-containing protein [Solirubrobacterales bacterium]